MFGEKFTHSHDIQQKDSGISKKSAWGGTLPNLHCSIHQWFTVLRFHCHWTIR